MVDSTSVRFAELEHLQKSEQRRARGPRFASLGGCWTNGSGTRRGYTYTVPISNYANIELRICILPCLTSLSYICVNICNYSRKTQAQREACQNGRVPYVGTSDKTEEYQNREPGLTCLPAFRSGARIPLRRASTSRRGSSFLTLYVFFSPSRRTHTFPACPRVRARRIQSGPLSA